MIMFLSSVSAMDHTCVRTGNKTRWLLVCGGIPVSEHAAITRYTFIQNCSNSYQSSSVFLMLHTIGICTLVFLIIQKNCICLSHIILQKKKKQRQVFKPFKVASQEPPDFIFKHALYTFVSGSTCFVVIELNYPMYFMIDKYYVQMAQEILPSCAKAQVTHSTSQYEKSPF